MLWSTVLSAVCVSAVEKANKTVSDDDCRKNLRQYKPFALCCSAMTVRIHFSDSILFTLIQGILGSGTKELLSVFI